MNHNCKIIYCFINCFKTTVVVAKFLCTLFVYFLFIFCYLDIDECMANPRLCQHSGQCVNNPGSYECVCTDTGFQGPNCDVGMICVYMYIYLLIHRGHLV